MDPNVTNSHDPGPSPSFTSATSLCSLRAYSRPLHDDRYRLQRESEPFYKSKRADDMRICAHTPFSLQHTRQKQQPPDKGLQNNKGLGMTKSWCGNGAVNTGPLISPEAQRGGGEETTLKRRRPLRHTTCELFQTGEAAKLPLMVRCPRQGLLGLAYWVKGPGQVQATGTLCKKLAELLSGLR